MRISGFSVFVALATSLALGSFGAAPLAAQQTPDELAASEGATILQPFQPWNVDFGENRCRLTRLFGDEDDMHLLMFEQDAPQDTFGITMAGKSLNAFRTASEVGVGLIGNEEIAEESTYGRGEVDGFGAAVIISTFGIGSQTEGELQSAGIDLSRAAEVDRVVLTRGKRVLSFETGSMLPPFEVLNSCTTDLLRVWGLDPEAHKAYVKPEWLNTGLIADRIMESYPRKALRANEQAVFRMRVIVDEEGRVEDCFLQSSTVAERLESPACREMRKARLEPARDDKGRPMRSFFATTVTYTIN